MSEERTDYTTSVRDTEGSELIYYRINFNENLSEIFQFLQLGNKLAHLCN